METNQEQVTAYAKQYGQVVAKAWADEEFKQRLLADPAAVLQAEGITVPQGVELRAVENTDKVLYFMLPPKPSAELSDEQLDQLAGGATASTAGSAGTFLCITTTASTVATAGSAGSVG